MKNKTLGKVLSGLVLGALLVTSGGFVLAASDNTTAQSTSVTCPSGHMKGIFEKGPGIANDLLPAVLKDLVNNNSLTQAQSDQLQALIKEKNQERQAQAEKIKSMTAEERKALRDSQKGGKINLFTQAVTKGIITQDEVDMIKKAVQAATKEQQQTDMKTNLAALVDKGTITSAQSDAIIDQFNKMEEQMTAQRDKMKDMTQAERQSYMQQNKPEKAQPLQALIDNNTLTQDQADAVAKILPGRHGGHGPMDGSKQSAKTGNNTVQE
ncbi:MAG: hypothetical protein ABFC94_05350 [Syntrophomonas sp.]